MNKGKQATEEEERATQEGIRLWRLLSLEEPGDAPNLSGSFFATQLMKEARTPSVHLVLSRVVEVLRVAASTC